MLLLPGRRGFFTAARTSDYYVANPSIPFVVYRDARAGVAICATVAAVGPFGKSSKSCKSSGTIFHLNNGKNGF
jgi:hypothetical protein